MKTLLEVLVQELKVWPKGAVVAVSSTYESLNLENLYFAQVDDLQYKLCGWCSPGFNFMTDSFMNLSGIGTHHRKEKVTKEQWEAAQWTEGVDLPPVGTVCMVSERKVKVLVHTKTNSRPIAVVQDAKTESIWGEIAGSFIKIQSEEEIQKDKHREDLELILAEIKKLESQVARLEKLTGE